MTLNKIQRARLFAMFEGRCAYCGSALPEKGWHADHVEPLCRKTKMIRDADWNYKFVKTGECFNPENDRADNFMPSCGPCNMDKSVLSLEDWRRSLERKPQVLRNNYSAWRHAERFGLVAQIKTNVIFHFETYGQNVAVPDTFAIVPVGCALHDVGAPVTSNPPVAETKPVNVPYPVTVR